MSGAAHSDGFDLETPRDQAEAFLETLGLPGDGWADVRVIREGGATERHAFAKREDVLAAAFEGGRSGENIYIGIAARSTGSTAKGQGGKDHLAFSRALFVDVDHAVEGDRESFEALLETFPLAPGMRVHSGGGEHVYFLLDEPFDLSTPENVERFENALRGLCDYLHGDRAATDASRILRIPGTRNFPDARKRAKGRSEADVILSDYHPERLSPFEAFEDFEERGRALRSEGKAAVEYERQRWDGSLPPKVERLLQLKRGKLTSRWGGDTSGLADTSASGVDASVAALLALAGCAGHEIEAALRFRRAQSGDRAKHSGYYARTVERALGYAAKEHEQEREAERTEIHRKVDAAPEWPDLLDLDARTVPEFPVDALPEWQQDFAHDLGAAAGLPPDMAGLTMLGAASAALIGRAQVSPKSGYAEHLALYCCAVLARGNMKSTTLAEGTAPLVAWEASEQDRLRGDVRAGEELHRAKEEELAALRKKRAADRAQGKGTEAIERDIAALARELEMNPAPSLPRLLFDDFTPAALASKMAANRERGAIISPEGSDLFAILAGKHSANGGSDATFFNKCSSGERHTLDRIGRPGFTLSAPLLAVSITIQPSVLRRMERRRELEGLGTIDRFLFAMPDVPDDSIPVGTPPVRESARALYASGMRALLDLPDPRASRVWQRVPTLTLTEDARSVAEGFGHELNATLRADGSAMRPYFSKLQGNLLRLAGVLHLAEHARERDLAEPITAETMERAAKLARYFAAQGGAVFGFMSADERVLRARKVLGWFKRFSERGELGPGLTVRKNHLWDKAKGGRIAESRDLDDALALLAEHGYCRRTVDRPETWAFNPRALGR